MADHGISKPKGRRQKKNKGKYERQATKLAAKKKAKATKAKATKEAWIKKDKKKNGKAVKGGKTHKANLDAIKQDLQRRLEESNGRSTESGNALDGGNVSVSAGSAIQ